MSYFQYLNIKIFYLFNSLAGQSIFWDKFWVFCTDYLGAVMIVIILLLIIKDNWADIINQNYRKILYYKNLILILVSSLATLILVKIIKVLVYAPRPALVLENVRTLVIENGLDSFPSLHSAFYMALALSVYFYNKKAGVLLLVLGTLVAVSRVVVGAHYPFDVIVGAMLGVAFVEAIRRILKIK